MFNICNWKNYCIIRKSRWKIIKLSLDSSSIWKLNMNPSSIVFISILLNIFITRKAKGECGSPCLYHLEHPPPLPPAPLSFLYRYDTEFFKTPDREPLAKANPFYPCTVVIKEWIQFFQQVDLCCTFIYSPYITWPFCLIINIYFWKRKKKEKNCSVWHILPAALIGLLG